MSIFKAYDIRGIYDKELNEEIAYNIGRASAIFLREKYDCRKIFIGCDARESTPELKKSLINGILDEDVDVADGGWMTTPMLYYVVIKKGFKGGIMITASHNPKEYNGFKIVGEEAFPIGGDYLKEIEKIYPDKKVLYYYIGKIYKLKGDCKDASEYFDKVFNYIHISY